MSDFSTEKTLQNTLYLKQKGNTVVYIHTSTDTYRLALHLRKLGEDIQDTPSQTRPALELLRVRIERKTPRDTRDQLLITYFQALDEGGVWKRSTFYFQGETLFSLCTALSQETHQSRCTEHHRRITKLLTQRA